MEYGLIAFSHGYQRSRHGLFKLRSLQNQRIERVNRDDDFLPAGTNHNL